MFGSDKRKSVPSWNLSDRAVRRRDRPEFVSIGTNGSSIGTIVGGFAAEFTTIRVTGVLIRQSFVPIEQPPARSDKCQLASAQIVPTHQIAALDTRMMFSSAPVTSVSTAKGMDFPRLGRVVGDYLRDDFVCDAIQMIEQCPIHRPARLLLLSIVLVFFHFGRAEIFGTCGFSAKNRIKKSARHLYGRGKGTTSVHPPNRRYRRKRNEDACSQPGGFLLRSFCGTFFSSVELVIRLVHVARALSSRFVTTR